MNTRTQTNDGRLVRRYDYADQTVVAADVGVPADAIHVDTVGERALVVVEHADSDTTTGKANGSTEEEFELELPGPATNVETTNGVLTITVER